MINPFLQLGGIIDKTGISLGGGGVDAGAIVLFFVVLIFVGILAAIGAYFFIQWKKYKYTVVIFKRVDGQFRTVGRDKAKIDILSNAGDQVFILKKNKKMLPMPSIQTGNNTYWYFVSDDGEWINFGPGDFDEDRREMGASFLDKEMRYARTELHQMADKKYDKQGFMQKYGPMLAAGVMLLLVGVSIYLIMDKVIEAMNQIPAMLEQAKAIQEQMKQIISGLDSLKSSGSIETNA